MTNILEKRIEKLETVKDGRPFLPLHIYQHGVERVPEKPYFIGKHGELPPMVVIHRRGVQP
jgi:hypothetical protein